jgi:uncharacterized membrane protein YoaK (UPF0700 family)
MGVGYFNYTPYLFPLTAAFLFIAVASLGFRAKKRRGYGPFFLGIVAFVIVLAGKFLLTSNPFMYPGIVLLMSASIWNAWPKKKEEECDCPSINQDEIDEKGIED